MGRDWLDTNECRFCWAPPAYVVSPRRRAECTHCSGTGVEPWPNMAECAYQLTHWLSWLDWYKGDVPAMVMEAIAERDRRIDEKHHEAWTWMEAYYQAVKDTRIPELEGELAGLRFRVAEGLECCPTHGTRKIVDQCEGCYHEEATERRLAQRRVEELEKRSARWERLAIDRGAMLHTLTKAATGLLENIGGGSLVHRTALGAALRAVEEMMAEHRATEPEPE